MGVPQMIRWRSSTQLAYSGEPFADLFRATALWSERSHIPVDVVSAEEAVDTEGERLHVELDVVLGLQTGGVRELADLAAHLASVLDGGWTIAPDGEHLRCEFNLRRAKAATRPNVH